MKKLYGEHKVIMPQDEIEKAIEELTPKAYQLLTYYYSKGDGFIFTNDVMANLLKISKRQLSTYHKELKDKKYLHVQKGEVTIYFIGKRAVDKFESGVELPKKSSVVISGENKVQPSINKIEDIEEKPFMFGDQ